MPNEQRVLLLPGSQAKLCRSVLDEIGVDHLACANLGHLAEEFATRGAAVLVLTDESANDSGLDRFVGALREQPPWSDVPVVILADTAADKRFIERCATELGNATLLERPTRGNLMSTLRASIRARERQHSMRALMQELKDKDRRKDEFLATLAHALRNPLAPIRNALEIMRINGRDRSSVEHVAHMMIQRQIDQMVRLVDDLLDVSRITTGRLELKKERIEVAGVIHSALDSSRPLIDAARHEVAVDLPEEPIYLDADPARLAQVFSNVVSNAARSMAQGGRIRITAERDDGVVAITVADNGVGVAPEALPTLFDMFAQMRDSPEQSRGGLGIGLSLVKQFVELHGGSVSAHSEGRGRGTSITVRLPVAARAAGPSPQRHSDAGRAPDTTVHRVLIADDNRDTADSMAMLLRLMGHEVRIAFDGEDAVQQAAAFCPDVILLDIGMPKLDGYDAARLIRKQEWSRQAMLVALTGWGQEEDKLKAAEAGFDRHFTKPVDPAELQRLIAEFRGN